MSEAESKENSSIENYNNPVVEKQNRREHTNKLAKRIIIIVIILSLIIIAFLVFHGSGADKKGRQKPSVLATVDTVKHKDIPVYLNGLGTVAAYNTVTVHSQIDGQLTEIAFHEGQDVKKGDVIAKIDPRTYQAQYDQAMANLNKDMASLENAQTDLKRYKKLGADISNQVLETQASTVKQLQATVAADEAAADNAKTQLSYTTITALIDGRTGIRQLDVGNIIHAGDANGLVVLTQLNPISVVFSLPQQNVSEINKQIGLLAQKASSDNSKDQTGLKVFVVDTDGHTQLAEGKLELVDNEIDTTTGTVKLKSTFTNDKYTLWPGGFVNVRLLLNTIDNALVIPTVAVQYGQKNTYVYVVGDENKVEMRPIKTSITEGDDTIVTDGLKENERIVTDGMAKLQDGAKISIQGEDNGADTSSSGGSKKDKKDKKGDDKDADKKKKHHKDSN